MLCPGCGKEIPDAYAGVRCPSCGASLSPGAGAPGGGAPASPEAPSGIPWENRGTLGFFPALLANLRLCLFDPSVFFARAPKRENLGSALGYVALLGWIGTVAGFVWSLAMRAPQTAILRSLGIEPRPHALSPALEAVIYGGVLLLAPLFVLIGVFIWTAILHAVLWIVGGAKEGFEATLRAVSYSTGSTYVFQLVPICGGLVGAIWSLVLQVIGVSKLHGISPGRAALAVLLPLALCCVVSVILIAAFAGVILAAMRSGGF